MTRRNLILSLIGLAVSGICLWWLFGHTDWAAVWAAIKRLHWGWLLASQVAVWAGFFTRVQRWSYIVRASEKAGYRPLFSATQIGFLANFTLPARLGEVVRAATLSRLARIPFSKCFAMVALDRVTDLIGLIVVMLISVAAFHPAEAIQLPPDIYSQPISADILRQGALGTGAFLLAVVGVLVMLYVSQRFVLAVTDRILSVFSRRLAVWAEHLLEEFAAGLHVFRSPLDMAKAIFFSLFTWTTFLLAYWCIVKAFGFDAPWYTTFILLSMLAVAISLPSAPGFIGPFHFAVAVGLGVTIPKVTAADVQAAAIVAHLANVIPIAMAGIFCLFWEGIGLMDVAREGARAQAEAEEIEQAAVAETEEP